MLWLKNDYQRLQQLRCTGYYDTIEGARKPSLLLSSNKNENNLGSSLLNKVMDRSVDGELQQCKIVVGFKVMPPGYGGELKESIRRQTTT